MDRHLTHKQCLHDRLGILAEARPEETGRLLAEIYHPSAQWRGAHPLNEMHGVEAIEENVWAPLLRSFPDLERRDLIVVGGKYDGRDYVATIGHYCGTFGKDWLTIPATGRPVYIRYGEVHEVRDERVIQSNCLWDVLDVIRQAGFWPIAPSLGTEGMWPGPITGDGLVLRDSDAEQSAASLRQTLAMHRTLGEYDDISGAGREGLLAMPQKEHWHPRMMWYGPAGIGTTRGLQGFVDYHQLPFRIAFPNRKGGQHYIRIGDGPYSVTGGWPSVLAVHTGDNFLGTGPTGRPVAMRVMDFYLHHEGLIRENWVPLDILDLLLQMGVDVMARMQSHFRRGT
jgi:predicted ester cyclase